MKAALYIRVSTQEQVENYSIASQRERLEAFCKAKGWSIYDTYVDPGYSGSNTDRPALQRLLQDIDNFDTVAVYRLDRLSRSQRDTLELIEDHFLKKNVDFVSITETLDTSTPFGKAMIGILSVFAQLERETITERMRNGMIKRAEEGYRVSGGDYEPSGYWTNEDGDLIIVEEEARHIKAAYDLYEQLLSITKMQARLKELGYPVWRFRRYRDILSNKLYCGYVSFAGKYYKGRHVPIIGEDQFDRVQILLSRHKGSNANKAKQSLLSGLITCGKCGERYVTYSCKDKNKTYRYYTCRARRFPSEYDEKCMNKTWNYSKMETLITDEISNLSINKKVTSEKIERIDYDRLIAKVDDKIERIVGLYADGTIDKKTLDKQINTNNIEKKDLLSKKKNQENNNELTITEEDLSQYTIDLQIADFPSRQAIVQKLIKQIIIKEESLEITWNH